MGVFEVVLGDITEQTVDAVVNAANTTLLGGGGVDGAIHRAAGPELLRECEGLGGCATGRCKSTKGYRLSAKWVLHTVGPVWAGGGRGEEGLLSSCYRGCMDEAARLNVKTIAFPSVSTGAYRFPVGKAARIAVREIRAGLARHAVIEKVRMVCFDEGTFKAYQEALSEG
jgi:O-acetyl-ADP-ribose deacetylase (regulator of RNase III)